jgi:hypothetical protein
VHHHSCHAVIEALEVIALLHSHTIQRS